jgi:hypothetical protein
VRKTHDYFHRYGGHRSTGVPAHKHLSRGRTRRFKRAYGDPFLLPIFAVAECNGLVLKGKEVVTGAAVRVWKGYEMRSRQCRSCLT